MTIQIEEGKYYRTRDGRVVGPMRFMKAAKTEWPWRSSSGPSTYRDDGTSGETKGARLPWDLVAEWPDKSTSSYVQRVAGVPEWIEQVEVKTADGPQIAETPEWAKQVEAEAAEDRTQRVIDAAVEATAAKHAYPDNNPKTTFGQTKPPLHAIPPSALLHLGLAMENGEQKYGLFNWRDRKVSSTVYYDAALRHLLAWWDGERIAPDSGVHHLGHVMACCAILLDAEATGNLNDNRGIPGHFGAIVEEMRQARLKSA